MSPSCGVAVWEGTRVHVWSHSQGIFGLHRAIAQALAVDPSDVVVEHMEGAGSYGHNGADDAAFDAVLLARAVPGRPVQVRWSRRDELTWAPFGSAMAIDVTAALDAAGCLVSWQSDIWSQGHTSRPGFAGSPGLLAAAHAEKPHPLPAPVDPPPERGAGSTRNAIPGYDIPVRRIRGHRLQHVALRSSSLRTLGAFTNVFAIESMLDELALVVGADPLTFRLAHLRDGRGRAVLQAAADAAGWGQRGPRDRDSGIGYGMGYARYKETGAYCAVVAEVEAVSDIRLRRLTVAADVGRVVNPDGVRNQLEGGAVQSASWTLKERVRFDRARITSDDWESYPILRFSEAPAVNVVVLDQPDLPSVGSGEAAQGPASAAIGNAVADAVGVRVRDLPITAERVVLALEQGHEG
jgi:CO/xanthine dehydrogenase Mo-binding subunit